MNLLRLRGMLGVAFLYAFFLIFAQFSFIELLRSSGMGLAGEKVVLALMAAGGIAGGFLAAWRGPSPWLVKIAMATGGVSAGAAVHAHSGALVWVVGMLVGLAIGIATVSMAALLPRWCRMVDVGVGTGLAYGLCNVPWVFTAGPVSQSWLGAVFAFAGALVVPVECGPRAASVWSGAARWWPAVLVMLMMVWLDSAAFFIIQHTADMREATWIGEEHLWRNAIVHFLCAWVAGLWLEKGGSRVIPLVAWGLLALAAVAVNQDTSRALAGWLYPAGVSLYSVVLVVWAGWPGDGGGDRRAAWRAAVFFGVAGWIGSANGIGMAQTLHVVPVAFLAVSGLVVSGVWWWGRNGGWRTPVVAAAILSAAWFGHHPVTNPDRKNPAAQIERGRQVYVAEGCIHCHSQYIRPGSEDERIWGAADDLKAVMAGEPVLIGNRRQGPDLSNVGARRSAAWLKAHFMDARLLAPDSSMDSYAHLFHDARGDDLVAYLASLGKERAGDVWLRAAAWSPQEPSKPTDKGALLFARHCSACHGDKAIGDGVLADRFARKPANLREGPFVWTAMRENDVATHAAVARAIKFGLPGTDMPGHETLTRGQIGELADWVMGLRDEP